MALAGFAGMAFDADAEDDDMFGGMLQAEADDDGNVVSNCAGVFNYVLLSHELTKPAPWHHDASLLMIVSVLRSLPAQRQAVFNGKAKAGRNSLNGEPGWAGIPGLETILVTDRRARGADQVQHGHRRQAQGPRGRQAEQARPLPRH